MLNVSVLETLNAVVYAVVIDPIVYVRAAPAGFDANVTETVLATVARFAVNVTVPEYPPRDNEEDVAFSETIADESSHLRNEYPAGIDDVRTIVSVFSAVNGVVYVTAVAPLIEYVSVADAPPAWARVIVSVEGVGAYIAVKEVVAGAEVMGTAYDVAEDTGVDVESSHLMNASEPLVAGAPMVSDSDLETLNGVAYEAAESVPIVYVRDAPDGFDASVTETALAVAAKFAVNVTGPV
jgi:hypothetical protein